MKVRVKAKHITESLMSYDHSEISRQQQDAFAAASQVKASEAIEFKRFVEEIAPVSVPQRKGDPLIIDTDEYPRPGTTVDTLAKLKPAFRPDGSVTAGNASGINDGAAMLILASAEAVQKYQLPVLAWIRSSGSAALEPSHMGYGPVPASKIALQRAGWKLQDLELLELNEAFAAQSLAVLQGFKEELGGIDSALVNVNGGAIALGHPIGASGARNVR